jgi:hypothetical protein
MPTSFISNYYLVEINYSSFSQLINLESGLTFTNNTTAFLASKFTQKLVNEARPKLAVQGKPGFVIQDVPTAYYEYTIEAPLLITNNSSTGNLYLSPYNSITGLALGMINSQWILMNTGYTLDYLATTAGSYFTQMGIVLESFKLDYREDGVTQIMVLKSTFNLLSTNNNFSAAFLNVQFANLNPNFNQLNGYYARTVRNYDLWTDMFYQAIDATGTLQFSGSLFTSNNIYLESGEFEIKFDIEIKHFLNQDYNDPVVDFAIKNYSFSQNYGIVGYVNSAYFDTDYLASNQFTQRNIESVLAIYPYNNSSPVVLLDFTAPMIIKTHQLDYAQGELVKTKFDFSIYGVTFNPANSNYPFGGLLNLYHY